MKKIKNDPLNSQRDKSMDKANVVFLKLLAKQKSKRKNWSDVRAETLPSDKSDIRNEIEVE